MRKLMFALAIVAGAFMTAGPASLTATQFIGISNGGAIRFVLNKETRQ